MKKLLNRKKVVFILSLMTTVIFSFIPGIGIRVEGDHRFYGFPAQWLEYYWEEHFSFEPLGLLFNLVFFYFVFVLLSKLWKKLFKVQK